jgi:hypothetical protein
MLGVMKKTQYRIGTLTSVERVEEKEIYSDFADTVVC